MNKTTLLALIRHGLTTAGGALAAKGVAGSDDIEQLAGALVTVIGVVWSIVEKRQRVSVPPPAAVLCFLCSLLFLAPGCIAYRHNRESGTQFVSFFSGSKASAIRALTKDTNGYSRELSVGSFATKPDANTITNSIAAGVKAAKTP